MPQVAGVVHAVATPVVKRQRVGETPSGQETGEERSPLAQKQTTHDGAVHDNGGMPPQGALDHHDLITRSHTILLLS